MVRYCSLIWQTASANFKTTLGVQDAALCQQCPSYEKAREILKTLEQDEERLITLLLRRLAPVMDNIRNFTAVLGRGRCTSAIKPDNLWGTLNLITAVMWSIPAAPYFFPDGRFNPYTDFRKLRFCIPSCRGYLGGDVLRAGLIPGLRDNSARGAAAGNIGFTFDDRIHILPYLGYPISQVPRKGTEFRYCQAF